MNRVYHRNNKKGTAFMDHNNCNIQFYFMTKIELQLTTGDKISDPATGGSIQKQFLFSPSKINIYQNK